MKDLRPHPWLVVVGVGALVGLLFASVSTYDFVMHLDRQVHDVHCSFMPGLSGPEIGDSGCQVTLVSPYSSVFRTRVWGGIPISLPAMAVFAFLLAFAVEIAVTRRQHDVRATGFLVAATALPALTSAVMAYVSLVQLGAACKLCIGIYASSALVLAGAIGLFVLALRGDGPEAIPAKRRAKSASKQKRPRAQSAPPEEPAFATSADEAEPPEPEPAEEPEDEPEPVRRPPLVAWSYLAAAFAIGVVFVSVPLVGYVAAAPDHERFVGTCGALVEEPSKEMKVPVDPRPGEPPVLEILDPLCPACLGFEDRLEATGYAGDMNRWAVLFPLDKSCNFNVTSTIHPGACAVSRAMLCAGDGAPQVLAWAFEHQQTIRAAAADDPKAASRMAAQAFPAVAGCIDAPATVARLNRSLHWAVKNRLPVLTPQLYVGNVKLCEEDVDIGLDFAISRMLSAYEKGTLHAVGEPVESPDEEVEARIEAEPEAEPAEDEATDGEPTTRPEPAEDDSSAEDVEAEVEAEVAADLKKEEDAESEADAEPEADTEPEADAETEPEAEPEPQPEAEPEPGAEPEADPMPPEETP